MKKNERAVSRLLEVLKPGDIVWTALEHVARSGLSRVIQVKILREGGLQDISSLVADALDMHIDPRHGGIRVSGCGMDMGFSLVYELGMVLWPNGTPEPHGMRNGEPDRIGGYALKQRWV